MNKRKFKVLCFIITAFMLLLTVPVLAVDEVGGYAPMETIHGDQCTEHTCVMKASNYIPITIEVALALHLLGDDTYLPCIESPALDCIGSIHAYAPCILPFCSYIYQRGPTFHKRVPHNWSVGYAGQTCKTCGRIEMF